MYSLIRKLILCHFLCSVQVGSEDTNCTSSSHFWKDNKQVSKTAHCLSGIWQRLTANQIYKTETEVKSSPAVCCSDTAQENHEWQDPSTDLVHGVVMSNKTNVHWWSCVQRICRLSGGSWHVGQSSISASRSQSTVFSILKESHYLVMSRFRSLNRTLRCLATPQHVILYQYWN